MTCATCHKPVCGCPDAAYGGPGNLLAELARVRCLFQQRSILTHIGINPDAVPTRDGCASIPIGRAPLFHAADNGASEQPKHA